RVHNSGHWTIEGAETSQFENHLRAVASLPLGVTTPRGRSVMFNIIGHIPPIERVVRVEGAHLHLYGKAPTEKRKVGHVTLVAQTAAGAERGAGESAPGPGLGPRDGLGRRIAAIQGAASGPKDPDAAQSSRSLVWAERIYHLA